MISIIANWRLRHDPPPRPPRRAKPTMMRTVRGIAEVIGAATVPAHGFIANRNGLMSVGQPPGLFKTQVLPFLKQLGWACLWASLIAAGMLVYNKFVGKWKEKGFPTIPIAALAAAEQFQRPAGPGSGNVIPLAGGGNASTTTTTAGGAPRPRQTSFLDFDDYVG
jgi:hypothetical protein